MGHGSPSQCRTPYSFSQNDQESWPGGVSLPCVHPKACLLLNLLLTSARHDWVPPLNPAHRYLNKHMFKSSYQSRTTPMILTTDYSSSEDLSSSKREPSLPWVCPNLPLATHPFSATLTEADNLSLSWVQEAGRRCGCLPVGQAYRPSLKLSHSTSWEVYYRARRPNSVTGWSQDQHWEESGSSPKSTSLFNLGKSSNISGP